MIVADFVRRGIVPQFLNPLIERQFTSLPADVLNDLSAIFRILLESKLVQN